MNKMLICKLKLFPFLCLVFLLEINHSSFVVSQELKLLEQVKRSSENESLLLKRNKSLINKEGNKTDYQDENEKNIKNTEFILNNSCEGLNQTLASNSKLVLENIQDVKDNNLLTNNALEKTPKENSNENSEDLILDSIFIVSLMLMGISVILILAMISKSKVNIEEANSPNNLNSDNNQDNIVKDNYSILDIENTYHELDDIKQDDKQQEFNDNLNTTGINSYQNCVYSFKDQNGFYYKNMEHANIENELSSFNSNNDSNKNNQGNKIFHKKNQIVLI